VKIARYEETQAQMKSKHDALETQYSICHSHVRLECMQIVDTLRQTEADTHLMFFSRLSRHQKG